MPSNDIQHVIDSALALPAEERLAVLDAIHVSLADPRVEHEATEDKDAAASWRDEIARRLSDVDSGRVTTVAADAAERMIRDAASPSV